MNLSWICDKTCAETTHADVGGLGLPFAIGKKMLSTATQRVVTCLRAFWRAFLAALRCRSWSASSAACCSSMTSSLALRAASTVASSKSSGAYAACAASCVLVCFATACAHHQSASAMCTLQSAGSSLNSHTIPVGQSLLDHITLGLHMTFSEMLAMEELNTTPR